MSVVDCVLNVDGVRFADTATALRAGEPTALAEVEVVWGRDTTVDQPSAGTCHAVIEDRSGGSSFLTSTLDIGARVEVVASGDVMTETGTNVAVDPGFEALPIGTITNDRVKVQTGTATVVTAGAASTYVAGYLTPSIGTVSTPDPGPLPAEYTFVFKVRGPDLAGNPSQTVAAQYDADPQRSWLLRRAETNGSFNYSISPTGTAAAAVTRNFLAFPITGVDEWLAVSIDADTGAGQSAYTSKCSTDGGTTWTTGTTLGGATIAPFDSTGPVRVGAWGTGDPFFGRIYWVELRTGLDPNGGTVVWRFDADDYPGTGTVYTDPRGRTWTLSAAGAITPQVPYREPTYVHNGAQAVGYDPATPSWLLLPPAAFASDPTAWDGIARFDPSRAWTWQLAIRPDYQQHVTVTPVTISGPTATVPGPFAGLGYTIIGDGAWHVVAGSTTIGAGPSTGWLGLRVDVAQRSPWTVVPGSWNAAPGSWLDYRGTFVDDVVLAVPPGMVVRPALVFSGVVTDLAATMNDFGTLRVEMTAVDQIAELENRAVGDVPWPAETLQARVDHVLTDLGGIVTARIDAPLDTETITWQDVDHQPAASLLAGYAQGVDGVLWSATHATTGPYLWIENPTNRAQVGELELQGAVVVIVYTDEERSGSTQLDGCLLPVEPITWVRDVGDVITRVDAQWAEQTLDDGGLPAPTDRTVTVDGDPAVITKHGVRRYAVTTNLISEVDAQDVAQRILNRSTTLEWRAGGLELDLAVTPPETGADVTNVLDLLDGTSRLGRGLIIDDAVLWPGSNTIGLYLEGGSYTFDGAWRLALNCSSHTGMGTSVQWGEVDPTWAWNEFDPAIRWFDLYGVAA